MTRSEGYKRYLGLRFGMRNSLTDYESVDGNLSIVGKVCYGSRFGNSSTDFFRDRNTARSTIRT